MFRGNVKLRMLKIAPILFLLGMIAFGQVVQAADVQGCPPQCGGGGVGFWMR
jgi:hypothetical protein